MKKQNERYNENITLDEYQEKKDYLFKKEFESSLTTQQDDSIEFNENLKHIQKMELIGKLHPSYKPILQEWIDVYPERFNNFCARISEKNSEKLLNFLHL